MAIARPRGRPPKEGSPARKKYDEQMAAWQKSVQDASLNSAVKISETSKPIVHLTDAEILAAQKDRFDVMYEVVQGACVGMVRGVIVSGAGGVGKTYNIEKILEAAKEESGIKVETVTGGKITPVDLYMLLWNQRDSKSVTLIDDGDSILYNADALSILKGALDSSLVRKISWRARSQHLKEAGIPGTFNFNGSVIFISNLDFQGIVDHGRHSLAPHLQALMTRVSYVDLKIHTIREKRVWIDFMVRKVNMLVQAGVSKSMQEEALKYVADNADKLRDLSFRALLQIAQYMQMSPKDWRKFADTMLLR